MMKTFEDWFDLWDQTKDSEIRRLCKVAWYAALAYRNAEATYGPERLTEKKIVDRAAAREETGNILRLRRWTVAGLIVCLVGLFRPVHTWLHGHLELLLGFLLGTLAQSIPWLIDRWRWLKWFSL